MAKSAKKQLAVSASAEEPAAQPRKASREQRRQQFIDATIVTLAERGYAKTTLTDVANTAGLSHGLVNFHFETKEKLLTETMLFLAEEYRENYKAALAVAGPSAQAQLDAVICADFRPPVFTPERLAAWSAFRGESQSRPIYQRHCAVNEVDYAVLLQDLCARMIAEGNYPHQADLVARVFSVMLEGLWLDMLMLPDPYSPQEAIRTARHCAAAFFPKHFGPDGPL